MDKPMSHNTGRPRESGQMTTPNLRAAAQAALDALEQCGLDDSYRSYDKEANAAKLLRAALAQSEPTDEPVAWLWQHSETGRTRVVMPDQVVDTDARWLLVGPLYLAAPPQRKPLTADEVVHLIFENTKINPNQRDDAVLFGYIVNAVRAVERAHGIGE